MTKKPALGLSITENTLEALELNISSGKYYIASYAWSRLSNDIIKAGKVTNTKALAVEIKKLISSARPRPARGPVVLGFPQSHVFLKTFTLPKFEDKNLEEAINWHIESLSPVIPGNAYHSYEVAQKNGNGEVRIVLVAAQKTTVDTYIEALNLAGLEVAVIEPTVMAKARLVSPKQLLGKSTIIFHLYASILTTSILVNNKVWFSRETFTSSNNEQIIGPAITEIINYFNERKEKDMPVLSGLLYCGDRSGTQLLEKNLTNSSLPTQKAEAGITLMPSQAVSDINTAAFAPVLGLALRGKLDQKGIINLLPAWPKEQGQALKLSKNLSFWLTASVFLIWFIAIFLAGSWWWFIKEGKNLEAISKNIAINEEKENELSLWRNQFNDTVKSSKIILSSQVDYKNIFSRLATLTPKNVRITSFVYQSKKKEWSITGIANKREDVLVFDQELKNSEIFKNAKLYFSSLEADEQVIFRFIGGQKSD